MSKARVHQAATDKPRWRVQFEAAETLVSRGESRAALALLHKALALNPGLNAGWRLLADIAMASGDFAAARHAHDRLIWSITRDASLRATAEALAANRLGDAERGLSEIMAARPADGSATMHLIAEVFHRRGHLTDAERTLRACLSVAPDFYEARATLAQVLLDARRFVEALAEFDRLLARDGSDGRSLAMKAAALTELGRYDEAATLSAKVLERFPDQPYAWLVYAGALRTLGRTEACIAAYHKCLELDPPRADAWLSLANLKTYRFTALQLVAMANLLGGDLEVEDHAKLHFALGKAREDAADYAAAFDHYARGNALEGSRRSYDPAQTSAYVQQSMALFTPAFFAARSGWGDGAPDPIFIVGLPRTGSTLVEQILASHPAIEGADELPDLPILAGGVRGYPERSGWPFQPRLRRPGRRIPSPNARPSKSWPAALRRQDPQEFPASRLHPNDPAGSQDHRCPPPPPRLRRFSVQAALRPWLRVRFQPGSYRPLLRRLRPAARPF